jgi:hypothetical protein
MELNDFFDYYLKELNRFCGFMGDNERTLE